MKKYIPNTITTLNIMCGALAIIAALEPTVPLYYSTIFILCGAIFDFLDGMFARLLKAYSPMGKELDSLADMLTFGMAPTVILYVLMKNALGLNILDLNGISLIDKIILFSPILVAMFSGLRLAKFNVDTRQTDSFIGLPTPANAILISSFPLVFIYEPNSFLGEFILNQYFLLAVVVIQSFLLVSEIPMFSLKIKTFSISENKLRYLFLFLSAIFIGIFTYTGVALTIVLFVVLSILNGFFKK